MRDELILAAIERFGTRGFDAVGTREIASAVGTPMSSITYHFGGKEGLYVAAAEHIFDVLHIRIEPLIGELPGANAANEERLATISRCLRAIGQFMLSDESAAFSLFINREQQLPTPAVLEIMDRKVVPMMRGLVLQIAHLRPDLTEQQAKAVMIFLFGMSISLRHGRASIGLLFETVDLTQDTKTMLLDQLEDCVRSILTNGGSA